MNATALAEEKRQLERMKDIYRFIKDEDNKPDDSVLTIIGKKFHDENAISDYLAYILNPQINGVGYQPLGYFLKLINNPIELSDADDIIIQREYPLPNQRRIDFIITINDESIIAIEHKVFSEEHGDQTRNYEEQLQKEFPDQTDQITYVFLSPTGKKALNPAFTSINYKQLVSALKSVNVNFTANIRKAVLYNEFIFHLEGHFLNDKNIALSEKAALYINHGKMIKDLEKHFEQDYQRIFQYVESVISNYFYNNHGTDWNFIFKEQRDYHQIFKDDWKTKGLNVHFELKLHKKRFITNEIAFLLDIEGDRKSEFTAAHEQRLREKLENIMHENGISYRKGNRRDTFASKIYHFLTPQTIEDESKFKNHLISMLEDFTGFIDVIDREINHFHYGQ